MSEPYFNQQKQNAEQPEADTENESLERESADEDRNPADALSEEEQRSIEHLCQVLYALYQEQRIAKNSTPTF